MNDILRHVLTSAVGMGFGLAAIAFVHFRWDRPTNLLRFGLGYLALLGLVALVSAGSEVYQVRCPDNPIEWCEYNDSTPAMFGIAAGYVLVALIRAWILNGER
jgi:hypothetical protein